MKLRFLLFCFFILFLTACEDKKNINDTEIEALKEEVVLESSLEGKYSLSTSNTNLTENNDVLKEFIYIKKDNEVGKWYLSNNLNDEIVELFDLSIYEMDLIKEKVSSPESLKCLKSYYVVFCAVEKDSTTKNEKYVFKTGYFFLILSYVKKSDNSLIISDYFENENFVEVIDLEKI